MSTHAPESITEREAKTIQKLYTDSRTGLRCVVALGIFCQDIKLRLPHGEFQAALEEKVPEVSYRTIAEYMALASGVLELCHTAIEQIPQKCDTSHFSHRGEFLLVEDTHVPGELRVLRNNIFSVIDGQSRRQVSLRLKSNEAPGGRNPNASRVQTWLKEHAPDHAGTKFHDLPQDIQDACWKWLQKNPVKVSAAERAAIAADLFNKLVAQVLESRDAKGWTHATVEDRQAAVHAFRDFYLDLKASLKGTAKGGRGSRRAPKPKSN